MRKANELFAEDSTKSFQLGLGDLSVDSWSLLPGRGNFIGEIHTRRFGTLTYARSKSDAEDITLFDRLRRKNIAVYASEETLARRGPSYSDDDSREFDVIDYNIDLTVSPGAPVDRRRRERARARAGGDARDGVAAAGRCTGGAIDHERSLRPAVRVSRQPPERRRHQPAGGAAATTNC